MNGIYLTPEGKAEIEAKMTELKNYTYATQNIWIEGQNLGMLKILEEIISVAPVLPVEESWDKVFPCSWNGTNNEAIKNGVIIQTKQ